MSLRRSRPRRVFDATTGSGRQLLESSAFALSPLLTDLDGGVGVLHVHKSFKDTQRFDAAFQGVKAQITKDGIYKEPSRFVYGEVMNTSDDFIKAGSVVDLKA